MLFSMAMTAWCAKFVTSSICFSVKGRTSRLKANRGDCERAQPCDQLGPAGCVVTHRKEPPPRQHHHVQAVLRHVDTPHNAPFSTYKEASPEVRLGNRCGRHEATND